jgi:hypothetical protein
MKTVKDFSYLVNRPLAQAEQKIEEPFYIRVVRENGVNFFVTQDFVIERVNVATENNIITEIGIG